MEIRREENKVHTEYTEPGNPAIREAGEKTKKGGEEIAQKAQEIGRTAQEKGREVYHEAEKKGKSFIDEQKHSLAGEAGTLGSVLHQTAEKLREKRDPLAEIPDNAARFLDNASRYLDKKSTEDVLRDTNEFARRHPLMVVGGMFVIGLLFARVLKTVPAEHERMTNRESSR